MVEAAPQTQENPQTQEKTQENTQTEESPQAPQATEPDPSKAYLLIPPRLLMAARPILKSFPGIWYMTPLDGSVIICASDNYLDRFDGEWYALPPATIGGGIVIHWMIPCPAEAFPGVWYVTDRHGAIVSCSRNYKDLQVGRCSELPTNTQRQDVSHKKTATRCSLPRIWVRSK